MRQILSEKLNKRRGIALSEMLMAVLILSLLTLLVATGSATAGKVYRSMQEVSEAGVLANSVLLALKGELRYAVDLQVQEDSGKVGDQAIIYDSAAYGRGTKLSIEASDTDDGKGRLVIHYGENRAKTAYPYQDSTYTDFYLCPLPGQNLFTLNGDGTILTLSYGVCDKNGRVVKQMEQVKVRLLNSTGE